MNIYAGTLNLYIGPMFSGKTSLLISALTKFADTGYNAIYITHIDNNRTVNDNLKLSHNSSGHVSEKISIVKVPALSEVDVSPFPVIGIDECQFFPDLLHMVDIWVNQEKKYLICAGLCGDAFMKPFGDTLQLIPMADRVKKLHARCHDCLKESSVLNINNNHLPSISVYSIKGAFTARLCSEKTQKLVGGSEKYVAVCRYHHQDRNKL